MSIYHRTKDFDGDARKFAAAHPVVNRFLTVFTIVQAVFLATLFLAAHARADDMESKSKSQVQVIELGDVEKVISEALMEEGAGSNIKASVIGRRSGKIYQSSEPITLAVDNLQFDETSGKFDAVVGVFKSGKQIKAMNLAGRFEEYVEVPVLNSRVGKGAVIEEEDVTYTEMPKSKVRGDSVASANDLVGKQVERTISEGRMVRENEIAMPDVIKKESIVSMVYKAPMIELKAQGYALASGGVGDVIDVRNTQTGKIVRAEITGPGEVRVQGVVNG